MDTFWLELTDAQGFELIKALKCELGNLRKAFKRVSYQTEPEKYNELLQRIIMIEAVIKDIRRTVEF